MKILTHRIGLVSILALVFLVNWAETQLETAWSAWSAFGTEWGYRLAAAASWLEGGFRFEQHDATAMITVQAYSVSYFFLLPVLLLAVATALWRRAEIAPFRTFTLAVALDYWISLPFFLLFPLPERWFFPDSAAILLSDLWSSELIDSLRPISGLDNSFPSTHTSLSVLAAVVAVRTGMRFRWAIAPLAATVVLSTFVLGIHWVPDILAGAALGVLSVLLAERLERALSAPAARPLEVRHG